MGFLNPSIFGQNIKAIPFEKLGSSRLTHRFLTKTSRLYPLKSYGIFDPSIFGKNIKAIPFEKLGFLTASIFGQNIKAIPSKVGIF